MAMNASTTSIKTTRMERPLLRRHNDINYTAKANSFGACNELAGISFNFNNLTYHCFSIYCRPSASCAFLLVNLLADLASETKRAIICLDANAKNKLWNSAVNDRKGKDFIFERKESIFYSSSLSIANVDLVNLSH